MTNKKIKHYAKLYSRYRLEEESNEHVPAVELKKIADFMEEDFTAGWKACMHYSKDEGTKLSMLRVILDQHFKDGVEVNLAEVGKAVGISLGYI